MDAKLLKFILVGVINTAVGMGIMFGLYNFLGVSYWWASATNYFLTSVLSYLLNKHFTFQDQQKGIKPVLKFALQIAACYVIAYAIAKPFALWVLQEQPQNVQENVAMLVGMILFTTLNYIGQRYFTFARSSKPNKN